MSIGSTLPLTNDYLTLLRHERERSPSLRRSYKFRTSQVIFHAQKRNKKSVAMTTPEMYLSHEDWSPRFDKTFFTLKVEGYEFLKSLPATNAKASVGGKTNFPAYYYKVEIFCGHESRIVLRRYSQFKWLFHQLTNSITQHDEPLLLPPASWCQPQNDQFAQNRLELLRDFLRNALLRRGVAKHVAVAKFLELDTFVLC